MSLMFQTNIGAVQNVECKIQNSKFRIQNFSTFNFALLTFSQWLIVKSPLIRTITVGIGISPIQSSWV